MSAYWKIKPFSNNLLGMTLCPSKMIDPNSPNANFTINAGAGMKEGR
jgi:hypothetical protein